MELRLYSWVNSYLGTMQAGIQTGHAAVDLVRKYEENFAHPSDEHIDLCELVIEWADSWKTFIVLNGGDNKNITSIGLLLQDSGFPYVYFNESTDALNGLTTCVAAVLPETIFNTKIRAPENNHPLDQVKVYQWWDNSSAEALAYYPSHKHYPLIEVLKSSRLAT